MTVESYSTAANDDLPDNHGGVCCAPSCWSAGEPVEIDDRDVSRTPVLCELHRKSYLGVST